MLVADPFQQRMAARLEEFWGWLTPWNRRLWNIGSVAAVAELLEACESLPAPALKALQAEVDRVTGPDKALGGAETRAALQRLVRGELAYKRTQWHQLHELLGIIDAGYLQRSATLLRADTNIGLEHIARSVAAHLLNAGFSPTYLHRWLGYHIYRRSDAIDVADLLDDAHVSLIGRPASKFRVVIPVLSAPDMRNAPPPEWLPAEQMAELIATIQSKRTDLRQNGGFVLVMSLWSEASRSQKPLDGLHAPSWYADRS